MDQIKIGKFIASCRKEQGMTQAVLAEKLGISDRAVSKWETGKSMPDSGIMLELCGLLKINVNELLSGEKIMAEAYGKAAEENLLALKRKNENNFSINMVLMFLFSVLMGVGIAVCLICDLATSGKPTWSIITLSAILIAWIVVAPVMLGGRKGILPSMIALSVSAFPFLFLLSRFVHAKSVFRIGGVMAAIGICLIWIVFVLYRRFKNRKLMATGLSLLIAIPFTFLFNLVLSKMIGAALFDIWDGLTLVVLLLLAGGFLMADRRVQKK